jgi:3-oxoacyl-[acyl-carrier protein] reductase
MNPRCPRRFRRAPAGASEDFAAVATFLCSEQANYVTGQALACDGGLLQSI